MAPALNNAAVEALCSAIYLKNYLDTTENLPEDIIHTTSQIRELDNQSHQTLFEVEDLVDNPGNYEGKKKKCSNMFKSFLLKQQENLDSQIELVAQMAELIENYSQQLQSDLENLDPSVSENNGIELQKPPANIVRTNSSKSIKNIKSSISEDRSSVDSRKRAKRKVDSQISDVDEVKKVKKEPGRRKLKDEKDINNDVDPNEPRYCICDQVSYGQMVGCDNENCEIEWFHFDCMKLLNKPKGKWYCPDCRGDKSNVMKSNLK